MIELPPFFCEEIESRVSMQSAQLYNKCVTRMVTCSLDRGSQGEVAFTLSWTVFKPSKVLKVLSSKVPLPVKSQNKLFWTLGLDP